MGSPLGPAFEFEPLGGRPVSVQDATAIIDAARAEADAIRAAAHDEGFAAGRAAGLAAATGELGPAATALGDAVRALGEERDRVAAEVEAEAVALAFALAEKVLAGALDASPERVVDVVRGALRRLVERDHVHVLVHPDDLDRVRSATDELVLSLGGIAVLDVQAERRVGRGGALVRTAQGEIDARVETQLERAREVVAG